MTVDVTLYINRNFPDHGIFKKDWVKVGTSWLTDKYRNELIGGVVGNNVMEYGTTWNEDTEEQEDYQNIVKQCDSPEEAIAYAKEYFQVTKVYDPELITN